MAMRPLLPPYLPPEARFVDGWGKPRKVLERDMRKDVIALLVRCGFGVLDMEPGFVASGKRVVPGKAVPRTPGAPDLWVYNRHPDRDGPEIWAIQVKGWGTGHTETNQQERVGRELAANGVRYTCGTLVEVEQVLVDMGRATRQDQKDRRRAN